MPVLLQKKFPSPVADAGALIAERLREGRPSTFIHVVPTRRKVRDAERRYLNALPSRTAARFHLYTLGTLAVELYSTCCPPRRVVDGPSQAILFHQAILNVRASLRYFRSPRDGRFLPQGTFQKIIRVINTMKEQGIYPSVLLAELDTADPVEQYKLRDVITIYEEYERLLGARFIDAAGYLKRFNESWDEQTAGRVRGRFPDVDLVVVSGFDRFSDPELTLLAFLSDIPGIGTVVSFDYHRGNPRLFGHLGDNYRKFREIGFREQPAAQFSDRPLVEHLARNCFGGGADDPYDARGEITLMEVATRRDEAEMAARIVRHLVSTDPDTDISRICIATFQPGPYTRLFRETFAAYGIPANITDRFSLDQSPVVLALLALLEVQERNFQLRDIMRALSAPYIAAGTGAEPIDAGNLLEAASLLRIRGGKGAWTGGCERRRERIARDLRRTDDDLEADRLLREQETLTKAQADISRLADLLSPFSRPLRPGEFREHLLALFDTLRLTEGLLPPPGVGIDAERTEKDARAFQKFLYFVDDYMEILREEANGSAAKPLSSYLDALRTALPNVRYNIRQKWGTGVQITTLEETRGIDIDVMIIIGLIDGEFPPLYAPEFFFSSSRRAEIERYYLTEHRYLFYQAVSNFTRHLYLISPRRDAKRQLVPSSFLESLSAIVRLDDRRAAPPAEILEPVYTADEYLRMRGASAVNEGDPAGDTAGQLGETIAHIARAAGVERDRFSGRGDPAYDGRIGSGDAEGTLAVLRRYRDRVYSVTQLESYGRCPFQYFAGKVLRLMPTPEVDDTVPSDERGRILHEILFEFYSSRRKKGNPPLGGCTGDEYAQAVEQLLAIARRKFDENSFQGIMWDLEKEWYLGGEGRKGIFREFLDLERSSDYATVPAFFEAGFGSHVGGKKSTDQELTAEEPVRAGDVLLRGKIDRVDIGGGLFRIVDYKTGVETVQKEDLELGISLQLPVYLYAVERLLAGMGRGVFRPAAGVQIRLRSPVEEEIVLASREFAGAAFDGKRRTSRIVPEEKDLRAVIGHAIDRVNSYVNAISAGEFPVRPQKREKVCPWCDFRKICRIGTLPVSSEAGDESEGTGR